MLVGAIAGAVIGVAVTTATSLITTGKPPSGGELLQAAASGAVSGASVGLLGPGASVVGAIGIGALSGAAGGVDGRLVSNAVTRSSWSDGLVQAGVEGALIGAVTGGVFKAAAPLLGRVGGVLGKGLRTVAGKWFDLANLDDTGNFLPNALKHIFEGDIRGTRAGGYHYNMLRYGTPGKIVPGSATDPDVFGVYQANVKVNGIDKPGAGISTFFPDWMSLQDVVDSINEAYNGRTLVNGNEYWGPTSEGFNVTVILRRGGILSAWPR